MSKKEGDDKDKKLLEKEENEKADDATDPEQLAAEKEEYERLKFEFGILN